MNPSEVRDLIGHQHIQLRILFVEVRRALEAADPRPAIRKLVNEVREHLDFEDRLLLPVLRELDSWGPLRAAEVQSEHAQQRRELASLQELTHGNLEQAAGAAAKLLDDLTVDMDGEESD